MLVLSRRPGQKVLFPSLGIEVEVLHTRGSVARLGIVAPEEVAVVRDEVFSGTKTAPPSAASPRAAASPLSDGPSDATRHEWNNKLNHLMLRLQLLQRQLELGQANNPEQQLNELFAGLAELEKSTADAKAHKTPPRVLLIEDQANERELLATCLRLGGVDVATAGNGREAFDWLHEHDLPDLILLDMHMPEVDGPAFLKSIRDDIRLHDLRVFAVSGSSRSEFDQHPLPLDGWFSKPVRIDALLQAVRADQNPVTTPA